MKYHPTKEHLSKQIPEAVHSINALLESLKQEIGADDRYVSLLLDAMAEERVRLHNEAETNFGFRQSAQQAIEERGVIRRTPSRTASITQQWNLEYSLSKSKPLYSAKGFMQTTPSRPQSCSGFD